jgi:hypothetical protein
MQIIDVPQGEQAWLDARLGIVTMSQLQCLLVKGKDASGFGTQALSYMNQLLGERITGEAAGSFGGNSHTERGHEFEVTARELYEERTGNTVEQCGLIVNHSAGYSPDGLVGTDGAIEIKSKLPKYQVEVLLGGEVPKEHMAQCQGGLWISEREWIDFISYWPGMPLFVKRAYRDEKQIKEISERVERFYEEMERRLERIMAIAA